MRITRTEEGKLIAEKDGVEWEDITHKLKVQSIDDEAVGLNYGNDRVAYARFENIQFEPTMTQDYLVETNPKKKFRAYKFIRIKNRGKKK